MAETHKKIVLSKRELERYSRQILLYGRSVQERLKQSQVTVVGAGGIGCALLPYLAATGFGTITIIDDDIIDSSNLGRQPLYQTQNIGQKKGLIAQKHLQSLNEDLSIHFKDAMLTDKNMHDLLAKSDFIFEGSDSIENKFRVSDYSVREKKNALIGGLGTVQGHIFPVLFAREKNACYRCVFEAPPENDLPGCATAGVLSPLPAVVGTMMAYLASLILIEGNVPTRLYLLDKGNWRTLPLRKNPHCEYC